MAEEHAAAVEVHGEEDIQSETSNPLLCSVVLDAFFNVCELNDLRRFRLVCRQWYTHSLRRWRKHMVLCISEDIGRVRLETDTHLDIRNSKALMDALPDIKTKPYQRFDVRLRNTQRTECDNPSERAGPSSEEYEIFWNEVGLMMKSLRFVMDENQFDWQLSPWFISKTPNLESLELNPGTDNFYAASEGQQHNKLINIKLSGPIVPWPTILRTFPNFMNITLDPCLEENIQAISDAMIVVGTPNRSIYLNCKHELRGEMEIMELLLAMKQTPNLKFVELGVEFVSNTLRAAFISLALCYWTCRTSIKTLRLSEMVDDDFIPTDRILVDTWLQLEHLTVTGRLVPNLNFVRDAPNLSFLCLRGIGLDQLSATAFDDSTRGALKNLKALELELNGVGNLRESDIALIVHLAPNLNDLTVPLDNNSFRATCTWLRDIRHLKVMGDSCLSTALDDEGITGIEEGTGRTFANITNLKYLYSFRTTRTNLSDKSIWEGFLKMHHLIEMEISFSSTTSDAAISALCERFPGRCENPSRVTIPPPAI